MTEPEAPDAATEQPDLPEREYRPRPPLWESTRPAEPMSWGLRVALPALLIFMIGAVVIATIGGERLLTTAPRMTRVEVVAVLGTSQSDGPAFSRYRVRLPDGREALYASPVVHTVGDDIDVLVSEGWLTKRIHVERPSRTAPGQASSPPAGEQ
jgi:hypothetical protein